MRGLVIGNCTYAKFLMRGLVVVCCVLPGIIPGMTMGASLELLVCDAVTQCKETSDTRA